MFHSEEKQMNSINEISISNLKKLKRGKTGLVYDGRMTSHRCLWNEEYPECPERFTRILNRCNELKLIDRCHAITSRHATINEILLKHTQDHYDILEATDGETNVEKLEEICTHYDVFIHPSTFELSLLAVGCAIELVDKILLGEVQNGMAIIRPPGHHAMKSEFDGFCFFNNIAIAAQSAINKHHLNRILIVDFDVHHGQGTQQLFFDDPRVLYFSIHRFDYGTFFPSLRESDFDYVGEGKGTGFNFNVPLNQAGMTNADYLAIWQQILLPVATEFQPELVLVSAGFDAAYGCPLGEMEVTPACYAHFISPLMMLAEGKIAAFLEGGYCLESLAESAAITLRTFLGDPCPMLETLSEPNASVQESILNCIQSHKAYWKCLRVHREYNPDDISADSTQSDFHQVTQKFIVIQELKCDYYDPRKVFPNQTEDVKEKINEQLKHLQRVTKLETPLNRVCFLAPSSKTGNIKDVEDFFVKYDLLGRLHSLEICNAHEEGFKPMIMSELLDNIYEGQYQSGLYIEFGGCTADASDDLDKFSGDNVISAAKFATENLGFKRVLIVDWNKSHGSDIFQLNPKMLCVSLYQDDVPSVSNNGIMDSGTGEGFAVNIVFDKKNVSDLDFLSAFQRIIMPIAYEYNPDLVLVSANFYTIADNNKYGNVSLELFGYFTQWLSALANGRIILSMSGDYKIDSVSNGMAICVKALLGDPLPMLNIRKEPSAGIAAIHSVISHQEKYWKSLKFNKMLPTLKEI